MRDSQPRSPQAGTGRGITQLRGERAPVALERRRSCTARKALLSARDAMPPQLVRSVLLAIPISLLASSIVIMRLGMYAMP